MARPRLQINEEQVKSLAGINCSLAEMAAVLDCSVDTLTRRYAEVIEKGRDTGRMSLKRKQWEVAMSGNVTMLIWLGKQNLGQTDKVEQRNDTNVNINTESKELAQKLIKAAAIANELK